MKALAAYRIPLKNLKDGIHHFHFDLNESFFHSFDKDIFQKGFFEVELEFDKRSNLFVLHFDIKGTYQADCDRCLAKIDLPVEGRHRLIVKVEEGDKEDEAEVTYLDPSMDFFDAATFLNEFVRFSMPLKQVFDCTVVEPRPCDQVALKYLSKQENSKEIQVEDSTWDILKEIKNQ